MLQAAECLQSHFLYDCCAPAQALAEPIQTVMRRVDVIGRGVHVTRESRHLLLRSSRCWRSQYRR